MPHTPGRSSGKELIAQSLALMARVITEPGAWNAVTLSEHFGISSKTARKLLSLGKLAYGVKLSYDDRQHTLSITGDVHTLALIYERHDALNRRKK